MIHGVDEIEGEDSDELSIKVTEEHMNQKIKPEDIDRSHRLGNRPIIVKYVRYNTRNIIYREKKVLKRKGISVMESLTAKRIKMLEKARELHGFVNVWSQDGKIMFFDTTINKVNVFYN